MRWTVPGPERLPSELEPAPGGGQLYAVVGSTMIANALIRDGHPFTAVWAPPEDPGAMDRARRVVRAAACAGRLRGTVSLRIGETVPGYTDVEASQADLARLGASEHAIAAERLEQAFADVEPPAAEALLDGLREAGWTLEDFPLLEHRRAWPSRSPASRSRPAPPAAPSTAMTAVFVAAALSGSPLVWPSPRRASAGRRSPAP